ncbi:2OG-Fe(II) oxygenase [Lentzea sp. NPDC102401]|uniref:2OG-Fe(II) oxygenase n=1 Tax=Lentzea sp. NPDC102401 TaxID=3364128 RepID=UPI003802336D
MTADLVRFTSAARREDPFPWYHVTETLAPEWAELLLKTFPEDGFTKVGRAGGEKSYTMRVRRLHPAATGDLPQPWDEFLGHVVGTAYRENVERLTGLSLEGLRIEVNLWRYDQESWLDPHVDKQNKVVTQVFYFNRDWPSDGGGDLLLLGSSSVGDVRERVAPELGSSVILVRGENSWHAVAKGGRAGGGERLSAQVVFHHD